MADEYSSPDIPQLMKEGKGYWYRGDFYPGRTPEQERKDVEDAHRRGIEAETAYWYRDRFNPPRIDF
jgi:hypothetical protein